MQEGKKISLVILLLIVLNSCSSNFECGNGYGISRSSYESKEYGVFINYYSSEKKSIVSPIDSVRLNIKEIYQEYKFKIGEKNEIIPSEISRVIIRFENRIPSNYSINWLIGSYDSIYFTSGNDYMDLDLKEQNLSDEMKVPICILDSANKVQIVDELVLKKVKI